MREGAELSGIPSESYDFVLSSHTLEHIANPLRALYEWMRILKNDGIMVLILPHKDGTFDHLRPVTNLEHLINDFEQDVGEDDLSHLPEILRFHDLKMDPPAGNIDEFRKRSENNFVNRCLHHHVFDTRMAISMMDYIGLRISSIEAILPFHIIGIGKKVESGRSINNPFILDGEIDLRCESPFPSDQV
ncbi:MAG: methyltransferase domain-containing protein [bacterium]